MQTSEFEISLAMFELLYWRKKLWKIPWQTGSNLGFLLDNIVNKTQYVVVNCMQNISI